MADPRQAGITTDFKFFINRQIEMAIPNKKTMEDIVAPMFAASMKPIWPNLLKRECALKYIMINNQRKSNAFYRLIHENARANDSGLDDAEVE